MGLNFLHQLKVYLRRRRTRSPLGVRECDFVMPDGWEARTALALASADNARIPRVPGAGTISGGDARVQLMHNGLKVGVDSYYGSEMTDMLTHNAGVHEPQEELVFQTALPHLRPGATMIELGAYWAFYSAWFLTKVPSSRAFLIEPMAANLESGRRNLALNGVFDRATLIKGWVGEIDDEHREPDGTPVALDTFVRERGIDRIDLLHADVQGAEMNLLKDARATFAAGKVDWLFLSTHSMRKHAWCKRWLLSHGMNLVAEADLPESYSVDGILVFKRPGTPGPDRVEISQRPYPRM